MSEYYIKSNMPKCNNEFSVGSGHTIIPGTLTLCGDVPRQYLSIDKGTTLVIRVPFHPDTGKFAQKISVKCPNCKNIATGKHKKLLEQGVVDGSRIEIICPKCKHKIISEIKFSSDPVPGYDVIK